MDRTKSIAVILVLVLTLSGCFFTREPKDGTEELASNSDPPIEIMLVYKIKKMDYKSMNQDWTDTESEVCGYTYDPWMVQFDKQQACRYGCYTRQTNEYRPWLMETLGECLDKQRLDGSIPLTLPKQ